MTEKTKTGSVAGDIELVSRIAAGGVSGWESFVEEYSGWVLFRARNWCESHCPYRSSPVACGLVILDRKIAGTTARTEAEECDDGMDIYIWIFTQLQKKTTRYAGKNNSRLSTFIWRILNSREFYIDWLRWRYGRVI